jgi:hypothetical protein
MQIVGWLNFSYEDVFMNKKFAKIFLSVFLLLVLSSCTTSSNVGNTAYMDFWIKVTIAVVSALLSFLGSLAIVQIKRRNEPQKQLSYAIEIVRGLVKIGEKVKDKVNISYNGQDAQNLYRIACDVRNTGNTVVKDQYIRFEFSEGVEVIDFYYEPEPEREIGVEESAEEELLSHEKRFKISHLERDQQVCFRFVLSGGKEVDVQLHPFNEEGDVEFVPKSISRAADDTALVTRFVFLYLLYILIPPVLNLLPYSLGSVSGVIVRLGIVLFILPYVKPFAEHLSKVVLNLSLTKAMETQVSLREVQAERLDIKTESIEREVN